ncbi:MAG: DMT family transporter [Granulosicoccus sp.]
MPLNLAALAFFGVCWGASIPLLKFAVAAGYHPLGMMIWQLAISVLIIGGYLLWRAIPLRIGRQNLGYLLLIAMIGTLIPNTFSLLATRYLPGGIIAIVIATVPIMSLLIALSARIESFSWLRFSGIVLGVVSLLLIAVPDASLPDPGKAPWILVALIAPVCYAIEGNFVAVRAPAELTAVTTLFGASACGLILLVPFVYANGWEVPVLVAWDATRWAIVSAAVGHMIAYTGYLWLLGRAGAVFTSQVAYIVTLTGVVLSVMFLGERYGITLWIAVALMFAALALVKPVKRKHGKPPEPPAASRR